ncbi:MAG: tetratricopeptide repeat protein [Desulfohalobiaceae bacterium]
MLLKQALSLHRQGEIDRARSLYEQILEQEPGHAQALHMLGLIHYQGGDPERAHGFLAKSLELEPEDIGVMGNLSSILASMGRLQESVEQLRKILEVDPERARTWQSLGDRLAELDCLQEASQAYEKALGLWPREADNEPLCLNLAACLAEMGRYEEASHRLKEILGRQPGNEIAHCNLGYCLRELQELEEACQAFRAALELQPDMYEAHLGLASCLQKLDSLDEGLGHAQRAREILPSEASWFREGHLQEELGNMHEARECYQNALSCNEKCAVAMNNMGVLALNEGDMAEASTWIKQALDIDPAYAEAWTNLANLLEKQGDFKEAEVAAKNAVLIKESPDSLVRLGYILQRQERLDEALEVYARVLEIDPQDSKGVTLYLAALGLRTTPQRAPRVLVQRIFDHYANYYDRHMCNTLEYRGPEVILNLLSPFLQEKDVQQAASHGLDILDLGCGTGLCGQVLSPFAKSLDGIDLSRRMLAKAQKRGIYHKLIESELTQGLQGLQEQYDCITACDVFVYLGDLEPVFQGVYDRLRPGGLFAFTVESLNGPGGLKVSKSTRYKHSREYLNQLSPKLGFSTLCMQDTVLRKEAEEPVAGLGVVLHK